MNTWRGSAWQFLGAGVRRMKALGCWGVQFRVTSFTNGSFISTQEWFACRRLNSSSHGDTRGLRLLGNSGWLCLIRWQGVPLWSSKLKFQYLMSLYAFQRLFLRSSYVNEFQQEPCKRGMITTHDLRLEYQFVSSFFVIFAMLTYLIRFTWGNHSDGIRAKEMVRDVKGQHHCESHCQVIGGAGGCTRRKTVMKSRVCLQTLICS